jgi:hypothetical protein
MHRDAIAAPGHEAAYVIDDLAQLDETLGKIADAG